MRLFRTIHPVGQGTFCTEKIIDNNDKEFNIVYDCGSTTTISKEKKAKNENILLSYEISQTFKEGEDILAVFISHFHKDHINGLAKLLSYCNVKYLFLPLISSNEAKLILCCNAQNKDMYDWILQTVSTAQRYSRRKIKTILINSIYDESDATEENQSFKLNIEQELNEVEQKLESLSSGTSVKLEISKNFFWEYIPYNIIPRNTKYEKDIDQMREKCVSLNIDVEKLDIENADNYVSKLKKEYDELFGSNAGKRYNLNSMTLYSGAMGDIIYTKFINNLHNRKDNYHCFGNYYATYYDKHLDRFERYYYRCCYYTNLNMSCLYLGDFDLTGSRVDSITNFYRKYIKKISTIQIPHHGSLHNFNTKIIDYFDCADIYFACAGESNNYRHPSTSLLKEIMVRDKYVGVISERKSSEMFFYYEFQLKKQ